MVKCMNNKNMVPKIRFNAYTVNWRHCKFSDLIQTMHGGASIAPADYRESGIPTVPKGAINSTGTANLSGSKYVSKEFFEKKISSCVYPGSLVTSLRDLVPTAPNMGRIVKLKGQDDKYLMPQGVYRLNLNNDVNERFLISFSNSNKYRKIISQEKNGSTQVHIRSSQYLGVNLSVPSSEEQEKIGSFFNKLDKTIALQQQLLNDHKQLKKAMLQKMFPQKGESVPRIRFAGFTNDWNNRKLSELASHRGGTAIEKYFSDTGKYKVISIGSYGIESKYVDQGIRVVSNEVTSKRIVGKNELTMVLNDKTANGTIIGRSLLIESDDEFIINQRTEIISPKDIFDSKFAYVVLNHPFREKVKKIVQGGTQIYVNYSAVENLTIMIPLKKEQEKIGNFFKQLDETIVLYEQKLETYQELKKAMLQKMFV